MQQLQRDFIQASRNAVNFSVQGVSQLLKQSGSF